ncbi:MAG TPA: hypothetical protein VJ771_08515 [Candidatus Nitrosotalea sp.]|nr:hypothetical protein [Candidatus Nitrosotalea sp.]
MAIKEQNAMEIAKKFLEQYHSILVTNAKLEEEVWVVSAKVGLSPRDVRKVMIDSETGKILGYT